MFIVIKHDWVDFLDRDQVRKFDNKDDAWNHVFNVIKDCCFGNIVFSDRVKGYVVDKINKNGIVLIWKLMRDIAHSAYPYENHKVIMIDTDKIK